MLFFWGGGGEQVFKWIHLKHKSQRILKALSLVIEKEGRMGGGFGGELDLQTEIVTDSHRTICANDMFQSVSLQYAEFFCFRASCMYNSFYLFKSLGLSEAVQQNYFHNAVLLASTFSVFI